MGMIFGLIVCLLTFVSLRSLSLNVRKDWDLLMLESIFVGVLYALIDSILFSFYW